MRTYLSAWLSLAMGMVNAQAVDQDLNTGWSFRQVGTDHWHPATVPGVVHTDLMANDLITDPYMDLNADSVQWIEEKDWEYRTMFTTSETLLVHDHILLEFKGLDTFASIYLNDSLLGTTDNMFRTWSWSVKAALQAGKNTLRVVFHSPVRRGRELKEAFGITLPHDSDPTGVSPFVRKAAYHFGWDFCPRSVTCGIWQPVVLRATDGASINSVRITGDTASQGYALQVQARFEAWKEGRFTFRLLVNGEPVAERDQFVKPGSSTIVLAHTIIDPQFWWPRGLGEQPLYTVRLELLQGDRLMDSWSGVTGLRTAALVQEKDSIGRSFHFTVNGGVVFAKGANIVPPDMFLPRAGNEAWVMLVRRAQEAGMNMLRVWAGGVYPPEAFFHACDTAGIMVWQDLMFANMIPGDTNFIANACAEVVENVERIAIHPCVVLFCGNNELEVAWHNWGWQERYALHGAEMLRVEQDMLRFFGADLPASVRPWSYTPTSPLSNWGNDEGLRSGDLHYWGVWHGDSTFSSFARNVGRFVSEFGFQSYPDSALLAQYIDPTKLRLGSAALAFRQRSYKGDAPIRAAMQAAGIAEPTGLEEWCLRTQEVQALGLEMALNAHLAAAPRCMGTLVWQLNDIWPGPSWSLIDHTGRPKAAFHTVREAFAK
ncbi:MAG: glycoside hydrolase family 2 protein [Flavobacteriales bacterium]|nr:glycoside hydrolase family 2 protein [Flavobacteriales bacterium]